MFRVILPPRQDSDIYKVYGVFKDSKVIRGPHWHYTSKDGRFTPLFMNGIFQHDRIKVV